MTAATVEQGLGTALDEIKNKAQTPLTNLTFHGSNPMNWTEWFPKIGEMYTRSLFNILVALTSGEANAIVRNVISKTDRNTKCGFSAFYALCIRFSPKTPAG